MKARYGIFAVLLAIATTSAAFAGGNAPPNIVVVIADNLGYGELRCYGGNRMVPTPRIDALASEGLRLTNFNVESSPMPSRSALLTGRYGVRSGTNANNQSFGGIVGWEVTLAEVLAKRGYTSALYGKWFLGNYSGRFPNDQGFDEWYGLAPRADGEQTVAVTADPDSFAYLFAGSKADATRSIQVLDDQAGSRFNGEITDRSIDFIKRNGKSKRPFFLYVPVSGLHPPLYCTPELTGKSGACGVGDALLQVDQSVGRILDAISDAGLASKTIFILTSDSGPEFRERWRGTAGPWSGNSNTAMEGSLRVPFLIRWPRHVPAGRVSNEIVHIVDVFTTLAAAANAAIPTDRVIDGVNQLDFFTGKQPTSNRESFPIFVRGKLYAEKWRDWKMHYIWWPEQDTRPVVGVTCLFNLRSDPQEKHNVLRDNPEVTATINQIVTDFWSGVAKEPLIKPGTPDPYQPTKN